MLRDKQSNHYNKSDLPVSYVLRQDYDLVAMSKDWLKPRHDDRHIKDNIIPEG